jgi:hypothetical protein
MNIVSQRAVTALRDKFLVDNNFMRVYVGIMRNDKIHNAVCVQSAQIL